MDKFINKRLLWIGCLESDNEFKLKCEKGYNLASAQVSQNNIVTGIKEILGQSIDTINGSIVPHYPVYKDKIIETVEWNSEEDSYNISVGYKNIKYINRLTCKNAMKKAATNWVNDRYNNEELVVIVYSMRSTAMATACQIKKMIPSAKLYLIVTDLPEYMDLGASKLKLFLKKIDWISIKKNQKLFDGFILYAEKMSEYLNIPDNKWLLMEGLYDGNELINKKENFLKNKKIIMYSGKLEKEYGIDMLLNAFMKIQGSEYELWLTGGGNSEEYIKECVKKDSRIKFYGFLPSRKDVLEMQEQASILLNMRLPSEKASKYCFPSKLFEYMVTGIPVVSFKIEGIPKEYYKYITFVENETEESLVKTLKDLLEKKETERLEMGRQARQFILSNKNKLVQCNKIINFIINDDKELNYEKNIMGM